MKGVKMTFKRAVDEIVFLTLISNFITYAT